jgi:hypothetical protein
MIVSFYVFLFLLRVIYWRNYRVYDKSQLKFQTVLLMIIICDGKKIIGLCTSSNMR